MSTITRNKVATTTPLGMQFWRLFDRVGPLLLLMLILLLVTAIRPTFLTKANLLTIGLQASVNGILAIGETFVIVAGGIDLSVGTMMSLSMVIMAISTMTMGVPMSVSLAVALGVGALGGLVNGFLIAFGRIPAFIVTLGMLGIAQGTALKLSGGYSMYGFPDWFDFVGNGDIVGFHSPCSSSPAWLSWPFTSSRNDLSAAMPSRWAPTRRVCDAPASTFPG